MITNKELISFLKKSSADLSKIDKLKVHYRPLVCPLNQLLEYVQPNNSVFDIGCGSGQFALLLAEYCNPKKIHGIEISEKLVGNARELLKPYEGKSQATFDFFDGTKVPSKVEEFDTIFMIDVWHHIPLDIRENFLSDLVSKMQNGARLILKDINSSSPLVYFNKFHDLIFAGEIGNESSKKSLIKKLESLNLSIIHSNETRTLLYPHFTIIAQK